MTPYGDSSALIQAIQDIGVRKALHRSGGLTRPHTFAEVFSTLTGGRLGFRCPANDVSKVLRELAADLQTVELDGEETLAALAAAQKHGVRGGQTHDYLHAMAAQKAGAGILYTLNPGDFQSLRLPMSIETPRSR
jgi:predicted nucleic acid-binding protein